MQFNLFDWIREGVKRSVILGVSDALDAVGNPTDDDGKARLAPLLTGPTDTAQPRLAGGGKRNRLGRSLRELDAGSQ